ncbi:MAG: RHS repeat-associated core domain-containing protein [Dehalococcoidia bacterium]
MSGKAGQAQTRSHIYDGEDRLTKILHSGFEPADGKACHDILASGTINISDVLVLKPVFGTSVPPTSAWFDIVPSGTINILDVLALKPSFGQTCGAYSDYDGDGLRIARWTGKFYTSYNWDVGAGLPVVLQETTKELHNDGDIPADVSSVVQADTTYVYGLGLISATDQAGAQRYYFSDGLGSTMVRVNGSTGGAVGDVYTYDVFGNLRSGNASSETMLFTGQQFDNKALGPDKGGLYYLRARYYDPTLGRFLTQDPMRGSASSPQTMNPSRTRTR